MTLDVLMIVEDPGAANFAATLSRALAADGFSQFVVAEGPGRRQMADLGVEAVPLPDEGVSALLARRRPRILVVGTSENLDAIGLTAAAIARGMGIPSVGLVDGPANAAFRFRGRTDDPLSFLPDRLLVTDAGTAESFKALGVEGGKIDVCGHPHHDRVRDEGERLAALDRSVSRRRLFGDEGARRRVIVFAAEISDGIDPGQYRRSPAYTLAGDGARDERTDIVVEEVSAALSSRRRDVWLVLRPHPKNPASDIARWAPRFDQTIAGGAVFETLHAADAVIGMTSMILTEAILLGRPCLSVIPRREEILWSAATAAGVIPVAWRRGDVSTAVARLIEDDASSLVPFPAVLEAAFPTGAARRAADAIGRIIV